MPHDDLPVADETISIPVDWQKQIKTRPMLNAPASPEDILFWAQRNHQSLQDARRRFMALVILAAVANDAELASNLIVRGSFALELFYQHPRRAEDIDFVCRRHPTLESLSLDLPAILERMSQAVRRTFMKLVPTSDDMAKIGDTPIDFDVNPSVIKRPAFAVTLEATGKAMLMVYTMEDIMAEKLWALFMSRQHDRKPRPQDVYDLAWILLTRPNDFSPDLTAYFFKMRLQIETGELMTPTPYAELKKLIQRPYEKRIPLHTSHPIPFRDAWEVVAAFFDTIPRIS